MIKLFSFLFLFLTSVCFAQSNWNGTKILTQNYIDRNPSFGMKNRVSNPYLSYEILVFERHTLINSVNICAVKMRFNGIYDSVFYVTSGYNICRNPAVDYFQDVWTTSQVNALVVWEQYNNGRWDIFGRANNSLTGWGNVFPVDTSSGNKNFPSVGRLYSDNIFGVVYEKNGDIIYREVNINLGSVLSDTNLTADDTAFCKKPYLSVDNTFSYSGKYVAFERQKSDGNYAVYMKRASNLNVWYSADTVSTIGNNRNPKFTAGNGAYSYITFESDRNGKWNIYNAVIWSNSVTGIEQIYPTVIYNCRNFSSFFYPVITDLYAMLFSFVREKNDSVKILSGQAWGNNVYINDSITVGDTLQKPVITIGRGIGAGRGYSTIWMVYNKDSVNTSKLYGKYKVILLDGFEKTSVRMPEKYSLEQNCPNPFNSNTVIKFSIPRDDFISLKLFDISGKEIAVLYSGLKNAGTYKYIFNLSFLSSGIYLYKLSTNCISIDKKMCLLK